MTMPVTYTHPDVSTHGITQGWADPETDPTRIDWPTRQAAAAIPFPVIDGRPVNPCQSTGIRYGRNELGHWGEQQAADAIVTATDPDGCRWLVMVERSDGHGWALPGGYVDPDEHPADTAVRELAEETGLSLPDADWQALPARYVPDPRASDESWMVTTPAITHLGSMPRASFPRVCGADDAKRAVWVHADTYTSLVSYLATLYDGQIFRAHQAMLADLLS